MRSPRKVEQRGEDAFGEFTRLVIEIAVEREQVGIDRIVAVPGTFLVSDVLHQLPGQDGAALFGLARPGEPLAASEPLLEGPEVEVWFDKRGLG
jgi:hypothetical protein